MRAVPSCNFYYELLHLGKCWLEMCPCWLHFSVGKTMAKPFQAICCEAIQLLLLL